MPQVDLENLVSACAGGCKDTKVACADDDPSLNDVVHGGDDTDPDFPPESFWLSKDAEYDWFDRTAFYYERKDSTRGNSNAMGLNHGGVTSNSTSTSQRFSGGLKSKAAIIGLPKTQKTTYVDSKRRSVRPANVKMFPKRTETVGRTTIPMVEPGSPKVSCIGRVRSKRCRRRSNSLKRKEKSVERSRSAGEKQKTGLYSKVLRMFGKKGRKKSLRSGSRKVAEEEPVVERRRESVSSVVNEFTCGGDPSGLGAVRRFTSGRRSGSWTSDDFNQAIEDSDCRRVGRS